MSDEKEDPLCMYLIVRQDEDIFMTPGKLAAQVGHAVESLTDEYYQSKNMISISAFERCGIYVAWRKENRRKVVLQADNKEWEKIKQEYPDCQIIIDAGYTCLEPNTPTVIGIWPMRKSQRSKTLKRLRTL